MILNVPNTVESAVVVKLVSPDSAHVNVLLLAALSATLVTPAAVGVMVTTLPVGSVKTLPVASAVTYVAEPSYVTV